MQQKFIINENSNHLLLFFAGWGMDETPFSDLNIEVADLMICFDYRDLAFEDAFLESYSSITLVAWSMGVWAASQVMSSYPDLAYVKRMAINGTPYPVDERRGIAPAIFEGTLDGLNERTLQKFQRRMCGSGAEYARFQSIAPHRPVEELKEELATIQRLYEASPPSLFHWDEAIVGTEDKIFLPDNQLRAWEEEEGTPVEVIPEAHYFDFTTVLKGIRHSQTSSF